MASEGAAKTFLIKHIGGLFWHPTNGEANPGDNNQILLHPERHDNMVWKFVPVENHWGYIMHNTSQKIIHPYGGSDHPGNGTGLVIYGHQDQAKFACRFAFDEPNELIVHVGGSFVQPQGGGTAPGKNTSIVVHSDFHKDGCRFKAVSPENPEEKVLVYGYPTLGGEWKLIFAVVDPLTTQTSEVKTTIGRSEKESTTTEFHYGWEVNVGILAEAFSASADTSLQEMYSKTSESTFEVEVTKTEKVIVNKGETIAVWQYVFDVKQNLNKGIYRSDIFGHTNDVNTPPDDLKNCYNLK